MNKTDLIELADKTLRFAEELHRAGGFVRRRKIAVDIGNISRDIRARTLDQTKGESNGD